MCVFFFFFFFFFFFLKYLKEKNVDFKLLEHGVTKTSVESAAARNEPLEIGGKALLIKLPTRDKFSLFVFSAARKIDNAAVRAHFGAKKSRFASSEELAEQMNGLVPGSFPPFGGPPLFD